MFLFYDIPSFSSWCSISLQPLWHKHLHFKSDFRCWNFTLLLFVTIGVVEMPQKWGYLKIIFWDYWITGWIRRTIYFVVCMSDVTAAYFFLSQDTKKPPIKEAIHLKQLQHIGTNLGYFLFYTSLVFPLPCTQWAFDIHFTAFLEVLTSNLG